MLTVPANYPDSHPADELPTLQMSTAAVGRAESARLHQRVDGAGRRSGFPVMRFRPAELTIRSRSVAAQNQWIRQQSIIGPSLTSISGYVALGIFGVGPLVTATFTFSNLNASAFRLNANRYSLPRRRRLRASA